jgi:hypothetical protein
MQRAMDDWSFLITLTLAAVVLAYGINLAVSSI